MSRLQSILTGIVTAVALVLVVVSIDFGKLASSLHQVTAAPVALAAILLLGNFVLVFLRFEWTLGALGVSMERRNSAYAFVLGNLANQFLLNIIGQSMTRAVVLQASGVPVSATVAATYLERFIALATVGVGAAVSALVLFGSFGFEMQEGGGYLLSVALAISSTVGLVALPHLASAIGAGELRQMLRTTGRLMPAVVVSLAAHVAMFAAYAVLIRAFVPGIGVAKLAPAIVIVMFAAGLPISWAGWGLREFGAVYAFSAIGVSNELAVVVAVMVGAVSLLIALAAGGAVVVDAWLRRTVRTDARPAKTDTAGALAPSDSILPLWTIGILAACLVYFQLRVPSGAGELTVNAADPLAITALFFAAVFASRDRFLPLIPKYVIWSICGIAAALTLGALVAWLGPGLSKWALLNRMLGFLFLVGYAAIPGLLVMIAGERSRAILADSFVGAAVVICAIQLLAYVVHLYVRPLPPDFFGYLFARSAELEGYAQNPNAFAFQVLIAFAVLMGLRRPGLARLTLPWWLLGAGVLLTTVACTRSRAGILCALGAIALAAVLRAVPARVLLARRSLAIMLVVGVAIVVLGIEFSGAIDRLIVSPFTRAWRPYADDSDSLRWQSTTLGLQTWLQHPIFGGGLGTFMLDREAAGLRVMVIHNVPIWFMAEMGLVGLAAYVFFVASLLWGGISALLRDETHARGLLIAVAVFVVMGLVHDLFFQRTFWFAAGLLLVQPGALARPPTEARSAAPSGSTSASRQMR